MSQQQSVIKKIKSTGPMRQLMGEYFKELDEAAKTGSAKVAWCTSVGPAELLRAFGFLVYFPENHGALLGSSRMAADLIPAANAVGYSPDICSYLTSDIGSYLSKKTPLTKAFGMEGVPKPTCWSTTPTSAATCRTGSPSTSASSSVPLIGIETPRSVGELTDDIVQATRRPAPGAGARRWRRSPARKLDMDRLQEVTASSYRCTLLWKKVLRLAEQRPSPLTFFDGTIHMGPAVVLRGDERAEQYYETLIAELEERIAEGVGAVDGESLRFYWEGMPVWGKLRENAETFAGHQACVVASTYCNSWIFEDLSHDDPFEGMARAYTELFIVRSERFKEQYLESMVRDYGIDGIIYHDCQDLPQQLQQPLRPARAAERQARRALRGDQRRPERPAPLLGGAGADPVRGAGRAVAGAIVESCRTARVLRRGRGSVRHQARPHRRRGRDAGPGRAALRGRLRGHRRGLPGRGAGAGRRRAGGRGPRPSPPATGGTTSISATVR